MIISAILKTTEKRHRNSSIAILELLDNAPTELA